MSEGDQLGVRALKLLAEERMVALLHGLAEGAVRPAELERRLPSAGHSLVMRRLRQLLDCELVTYDRKRGTPPHADSAGVPHEARYNLADAGRALLEITDEASRWERCWCAHDERRGAEGALAIGLTADPHSRKITLLLADRPLCARELDAGAGDLGRSALRRRLRELVLAGLLERRAQGRYPTYELTAAARHLALVAMLAGRWEWRWSTPRRPRPGRDLDRLLHLLAPAARVPEPVDGICRLRLDACGGDDPDIYLSARAGHLLALEDPPARPPEAIGHASAEAWCNALLTRRGTIAISGNQTLLVAVIDALSTALLL
jgi:DNA-binding HxlR family transcriptional regulator